MTIEMAPKAPAAMSAKAAESSSGKQSADDSAGATRTGAGSFLFALASVELGEQVPVGEGLPPELVAEGALPVDEEFLFEAKFDASAALVNPAFLLTQVQVAPTPEVVVPARAGVNAAGRGQDGFSPLQAVVEPSLLKSNVPPSKSGKAALDAASEGLNPLNGDVLSSGGSGAAPAPAKDALVDRVHHTLQGLVDSLAKAANVSTLSLASSKDHVQELQSSPRLTNDISVQAWAAPQGGVMGSDGVVAGAPTSGADGQFSEQVSYWIGADVQKAEMTLDGFGTNPVEVSISMQGREATVVFRTDEAVTRDALSNASEQLQDALERQGVVLSGVSVGTSNSGDSPRQGAGGRQPNWKSATIQTVADGGAVNSVKSGASGRSVDLFV